jgi:hypothetical protein
MAVTKIIAQQIDEGVLKQIPSFAVASGTNTYTATLTPAITAYTAGMVVTIQFTNGSTSSTPTLNLNSLGAVTIVKRNSIALVSGDISAGQFYKLVYDGTNFRILGAANHPHFIDVTISNQAAATSKLRPLYISDTGKVFKTAFYELDETNKTITFEGVDALTTSTLALFKNSSGQTIMAVKNGQVVEFGGTASIWEVGTGVASDNARLTFNDNQANAYKYPDQTGTEYIVVKTTTGDLSIVHRQKIEHNQSLGFTTIRRQFFATVTAGGATVVGSIACASGFRVFARVIALKAVATDGSGAFADGNMTAGVKNDSGTTATLGTLPTYTLHGDNITGAAWAMIANDTDDRLDITFTNNTTPKSWRVLVEVEYTTIAIPV